MRCLEQLVSQWRNLVSQLGVEATLSSARSHWPDKTVIVGLKTAGWQEQELVNTYGIGTRMITFDVLDFSPGQAPEKFDRLTLKSGEVLVMDAVFPVEMGGERIGYKGISRGDGS